MAVIIKLWRHIENPTQSMRIYSKNNPAKFHPDLIWNDRALGFFCEAAHPNNKKNNNKPSGDIRSVRPKSRNIVADFSASC